MNNFNSLKNLINKNYAYQNRLILKQIIDMHFIHKFRKTKTENYFDYVKILLSVYLYSTDPYEIAKFGLQKLDFTAFLIFNNIIFNENFLHTLS